MIHKRILFYGAQITNPMNIYIIQKLIFENKSQLQ